MTNEFEQAALAYHKSSLEWQQRYNIAIAERDALRDQWSGLLIEQARLMALRDEAIAERDALRKELAKFPVLDGALLIPCKALEVQP